MEFREFVRMLEAGGLFATTGPGFSGSPLHPNNCDPYLSKSCGGSGGTPAAAPSAAVPPPKKMKKMKK